MIDSFSPIPTTSVVGTTLREHVLVGMRAAPGATGQFTSLLNHISLAIRIIASRVKSAGLAGMLGYTGEINVQGESVQKLDAYANAVLLNILERSGHCGIIGSEELDEARIAEYGGKYVVLFDPLDGSSLIDSNGSIGTIFAILRRQPGELIPVIDDALQPGTEIAAAGYALYGPSTAFVLATRHGVDGFTLDPNVGEFFLSQPNIRCPARGKTFSCNQGNRSGWSEGVRRWNDWVLEHAPDDGRPYGLRYMGSLVGDAHRTLLSGGIFAYPADKKSPKGKLRLLYEANPMAFIFEQAGGAATNGQQRILELRATDLHERVPLALGSKEDVETYAAFASGER